MRGEDHEALGGEPADGLAQGRDADADAGGELLLVDRLARRKVAVGDALAQDVVGVVGLGLEEDGAHGLRLIPIGYGPRWRSRRTGERRAHRAASRMSRTRATRT